MFYLLLFLTLVYGYQPPQSPLTTTEILRYKNYFRPIPFKTLVEEMDNKQIESVYFTPTMDSVIAEEKEKSVGLPISSSNTDAISFFNKAQIHDQNFEFDEAKDNPGFTLS